jgi:hypothetical protein
VAWFSPVDVKPEGTAGLVKFDHIYIDNNTMISGTNKMYSGILIETGGVQTNMFARNNIIRGADDAGILFSYSLVSASNNPAILVQKNLYYLNGTDAVGYNEGGGVVDKDGISISTVPAANPNFMGAADFHLQAGSPAIGTGIHITTPAYALDYDGTAVGDPPEIGAFEYSAFAAVIPTVTTTNVSQITKTTAVSGGVVTADGGATVTDRGICWALSPNPTTGDSHAHNSSGIGSFASSISGLTENLTYHVRAFATNSVGTAYGTDIQFSARGYQIVIV